MSGYILIVDDNPNNLRLLIAILQERGYQIRPANNGARALSTAKKQKPDLILLDINMPEMDGYEVCRQLKADPETADIPVLFISANDELHDRIHGFAVGGVDYISKPFQEAEVLARIESQLTILTQRRQLAGILNSSLDGIMAYQAVRDPEGHLLDFRWLELNPAAAEMVGKKREELLGEHLLVQFPFLQSEGIFAEYVQVVETGQSLNKEYYLAQFESWIQMFAVKLDDGLAVTFRNTTERKNLELTLARQAEQDGLTGIANRRVFDQQLAHEWRRSVRTQKPLSLIMCDIDFFKLYNDLFGHIQGDLCLIQVAQTLMQMARRSGDLVSRYGGEEFAVILPETDAAGAKEVAEHLAQAVRDLALPHPHNAHQGIVTLSLGVATLVPHRGVAETELLLAADQALYRAKEKGRNQVQVSASSDQRES
ncbi:MAG: diguanylate cyclase [Candidatus Sericytochromatia bacterium]